MVFANLFIYLFQISGSGHSSLETTSKHWVNCVKTSTTDTLNSACSLLFWNCEQFYIQYCKRHVYIQQIFYSTIKTKWKIIEKRIRKKERKEKKRLLRPSCLCWRHHGDIPVRRHRSRLTIASQTARTTQGTRARRLCKAAHPSRNWYATIWPWSGGSCRPKICTICAARAPPTRISCQPRTRTTWWPPTIDRCSIPGGIGWGRVRSCFYPPRSPKRSARSICARSPTIPNEGRDPRRPSSPRSDQLGIPCCRCRSNSRRGTGRSIEGTPSRNPWPRCSPWAGWTIPKLSYGRMWCSWEGRPYSSGPSASPGSRQGSYSDTSRDRFEGSCAADPIISRTSLSAMAKKWTVREGNVFCIEFP